MVMKNMMKSAFNRIAAYTAAAVIGCTSAPVMIEQAYERMQQINPGISSVQGTSGSLESIIAGSRSTQKNTGLPARYGLGFFDAHAADVTIAWDHNKSDSTTVFYEVQVAKANSDFFADGFPTDLRYTINNLDENQTYWIRVRAWDNIDDAYQKSGWSETISYNSGGIAAQTQLDSDADGRWTVFGDADIVTKATLDLGDYLALNINQESSVGSAGFRTPLAFQMPPDFDIMTDSYVIELEGMVESNADITLSIRDSNGTTLRYKPVFMPGVNQAAIIDLKETIDPYNLSFFDPSKVVHEIQLTVNGTTIGGASENLERLLLSYMTIRQGGIMLSGDQMALDPNHARASNMPSRIFLQTADMAEKDFPGGLRHVLEFNDPLYPGQDLVGVHDAVISGGAQAEDLSHRYRMLFGDGSIRVPDFRSLIADENAMTIGIAGNISSPTGVIYSTNRLGLTDKRGLNILCYNNASNVKVEFGDGENWHQAWTGIDFSKPDSTLIFTKAGSAFAVFHDGSMEYSALAPFLIEPDPAIDSAVFGERGSGWGKMSGNMKETFMMDRAVSRLEAMMLEENWRYRGGFTNVLVPGSDHTSYLIEPRSALGASYSCSPQTLIYLPFATPDSLEEEVISGTLAQNNGASHVPIGHDGGSARLDGNANIVVPGFQALYEDGKITGSFAFRVGKNSSDIGTHVLLDTTHIGSVSKKGLMLFSYNSDRLKIGTGDGTQYSEIFLNATLSVEPKTNILNLYEDGSFEMYQDGVLTDHGFLPRSPVVNSEHEDLWIGSRGNGWGRSRVTFDYVAASAEPISPYEVRRHEIKDRTGHDFCHADLPGKASFGFLAKDGPVSIDESAFDMIVTYDRSAVMPNTGLDITLLSEGQGYKEFHIPYAELAYGNGFIRRENLSQSTTGPFFDPGNIIGGIAHVAYDSGISGTAKVIPNVRIELKPR